MQHIEPLAKGGYTGVGSKTQPGTRWLLVLAVNSFDGNLKTTYPSHALQSEGKTKE
jgi:hypothetical protein